MKWLPGQKTILLKELCQFQRVGADIKFKWQKKRGKNKQKNMKKEKQSLIQSTLGRLQSKTRGHEPVDYIFNSYEYFIYIYIFIYNFYIKI